MKRLILVRHAKSSWAYPNLSDFDRPLNKRGKRDAPVMGKRLIEHGMVPDKIVSSPAVRALSTARVLAKALDIPTGKINEEPGIYEASAIRMLGLMREWKEKWDTVLMVGHMPGLGDLVQLLTDADPGPIPTCCVLEIELSIDHWTDATPGCAQLNRMMKPKDKTD